MLNSRLEGIAFESSFFTYSVPLSVIGPSSRQVANPVLWVIFAQCLHASQCTDAPTEWLCFTDNNPRDDERKIWEVSDLIFLEWGLPVDLPIKTPGQAMTPVCLFGQCMFTENRVSLLVLALLQPSNTACQKAHILVGSVHH